jgi:signal peptidase I
VQTGNENETDSVKGPDQLDKHTDHDNQKVSPLVDGDAGATNTHTESANSETAEVAEAPTECGAVEASNDREWVNEVTETSTDRGAADEDGVFAAERTVVVGHDAGTVQTDEGAPAAELTRGQKVRREIWEWTKAIPIAIVVVLLLRFFIFGVFMVEGESMQPNYYTGQRLIANKIVYNFADPQRGDVIVFNVPQDNNRDYIKRVIGVPGDQVLYVGDDLYINGELVVEEYLAGAIAKAQAEGSLYNYGGYNFNFPNQIVEGVVPEGTVLAFGDNRPNSNDSRMIGFVPFDEILGRVDLRIWPFSDFGLIKRGVTTATGEGAAHE